VIHDYDDEDDPLGYTRFWQAVILIVLAWIAVGYVIWKIFL
jgi:hypothetical protein